MDKLNCVRNTRPSELGSTLNVFYDFCSTKAKHVLKHPFLSICPPKTTSSIIYVFDEVNAKIRNNSNYYERKIIEFCFNFHRKYFFGSNAPFKTCNVYLPTDLEPIWSDHNRSDRLALKLCYISINRTYSESKNTLHNHFSCS